jgi:hypothetical protein
MLYLGSLIRDWCRALSCFGRADQRGLDGRDKKALNTVLFGMKYKLDPIVRRDKS